MTKLGSVLGALALGLATASATVLEVTIPASRSSGRADEEIEAAARQFTRNAAALTRDERQFRSRAGQPVELFTLPVTVKIANPAPGSTRASRARGDLTISFDTSGTRAFPPTYRDFLIDVFNRAQPVLNNLFGLPSESGEIKVLNYDADIGDRDAVAGGIYVHNNGGIREIRFPVYQDTGGIKGEVAAINFIHTLLLAYLGGKSLPNDGWREGLVRSVTMAAARTPGALPAGLDQGLVTDTLFATYDTGPTYDWVNQPALASPEFIAPNLKNTALPIGGSTGGLYLVRYQMAGSAMQKVLVQYPTFAREFLNRYYLNPNLYPNTATLSALGQTTLVGLGESLVEGYNFPTWASRQYILGDTLQPGRKLLVQPFPFVDGLTGNDFGVFGIQAHVFETAANGNETLSRETSFPLYWSPEFNRVFASVQDDRIDVIAGYGSVAPNFVDAFGGSPYRVVVDVPVRDQMARVALPAGAVATAANPTPNDIYGTIMGLRTVSGASYEVRVRRGSQTFVLPVTQFAFGDQTGLTNSGRLTVELWQIQGSTSTRLLARDVNKGPGSLALNLVLPTRSETTVVVPRGVSMFGFIVDPWRPDLRGALEGSGNDSLFARWDPLQGRYRFDTEAGLPGRGRGYFTRMPAVRSMRVVGVASDAEPVSVALEPGWNLITNPLGTSFDLNNVEVYKETDIASDYSDARGTILGLDAFRFVAGANDPASGVPEGGSFTATTNVAPGEGIYVRCLSSTGATLVFRPSASPGRSASRPAPAWEFKATVTAPLGSATGFLGQTSGASQGFDGRFDSQLPPASDGVQLAVGSRLYRDHRAVGPAERYPLRLTGLVPGQIVEVRLTTTAGTPPLFFMRDSQTGFSRKFRATGLYRFRARSTEHVVNIDTERLR